MPRSVSIAVVFAMLSSMGLSAPAFAECFEVKGGQERTHAVSSDYESKSSSAWQLEATYSRPFSGRWSVFGQYQVNSTNTLSGGGGGIAFDSEDDLARGGSIGPDGVSEIIKRPIWLLRTAIGFGVLKYVDKLRSTNDNLGDLNQVPVQADLYSLKFSLSLLRFVSAETGVSLSYSYASGSASAFGISSMAATAGILYQPL